MPQVVLRVSRVLPGIFDSRSLLHSKQHSSIPFFHRPFPVPSFCPRHLMNVPRKSSVKTVLKVIEISIVSTCTSEPRSWGTPGSHTFLHLDAVVYGRTILNCGSCSFAMQRPSHPAWKSCQSS